MTGPGRETDAPDLARLFVPRSVAVIGAADDPVRSQVATRIFTRIRQRMTALGATTYPVHARRAEVAGLRAFPSVLDVPDDIDVAVVLVSDAVGAMRDIVAKGIPFALVFAAGFAETGQVGVELQRRLAAVAAGSATRILGPNTTTSLWDPLRTDLPGKRISIVTHSGGQGQWLLQAQELGAAVGRWVGTGNEVDLDVADFISYFADDPDTGAIAIYVEGFHDGRKFLRSVDHAARRGVPVAAVLAGRTALGRAATVAHTGHLGGSDAIADAALRQFGVLRTEELDTLLRVAALLARSAPPRASGVCVYGNSGGATAHLTDMFHLAGVPTPELTPETRGALAQWLPPFLNTANPVDIGGAVIGPDARDILRAVVADPNVGIVACPITQTRASDRSPDLVGAAIAADLAAVAGETDKPICAIWGSVHPDEPAYREILLGSDVHLFESFRNCTVAVAAYLSHHAFTKRYAGTDPSSWAPSRAAAAARAFATPGKAMAEHEAKRLLALYGIPVTQEAVVQSRAEAVRVAQELGYPVVAKVASVDIPHKSDVGLVELGLRAAVDVSEAYDRLLERAAAAVPGAAIDGILISRHERPGVETICGIAQDADFGPAVMFGLGGVAVELFGDVSFRVPPFDAQEARRMIDEVKASRLLFGFRGSEPVDVDAVIDVLLRLGRLALDLDGALELDINPLIARPDGVVAVDALAVWS